MEAFRPPPFVCLFAASSYVFVAVVVAVVVVVAFPLVAAVFLLWCFFVLHLLL